MILQKTSVTRKLTLRELEMTLERGRKMRGTPRGWSDEGSTLAGGGEELSLQDRWGMKQERRASREMAQPLGVGE